MGHNYIGLRLTPCPIRASDVFCHTIKFSSSLTVPTPTGNSRVVGTPVLHKKNVLPRPARGRGSSASRLSSKDSHSASDSNTLTQSHAAQSVWRAWSYQSRTLSESKRRRPRSSLSEALLFLIPLQSCSAIVGFGASNEGSVIVLETALEVVSPLSAGSSHQRVYGFRVQGLGFRTFGDRVGNQVIMLEIVSHHGWQVARGNARACG